jgi:hypothetical protein
VISFSTFSLSEKASNECQDNTQDDAEQDHRRNRGIQAKPGALDSNIAGQVAQPAEPITPKPDYQADDDQYSANDNDCFAQGFHNIF